MPVEVLAEVVAVAEAMYTMDLLKPPWNGAVQDSCAIRSPELAAVDQPEQRHLQLYNIISCRHRVLSVRTHTHTRTCTWLAEAGSKVVSRGKTIRKKKKNTHTGEKGAGKATAGPKKQEGQEGQGGGGGGGGEGGGGEGVAYITVAATSAGVL